MSLVAGLGGQLKRQSCGGRLIKRRVDESPTTSVGSGKGEGSLYLGEGQELLTCLAGGSTTTNNKVASPVLTRKGIKEEA